VVFDHFSTLIEAVRQIPDRSTAYRRASGETRPPELVLGFGNLSEHSIERGIATIADLLRTI
jgi:hypothetical protein